MYRTASTFLVFLLASCATINSQPPFTTKDSAQPFGTVIGKRSPEVSVGIFSVDEKCLGKNFDIHQRCFVTEENTAYLLTGIRKINAACLTKTKYSTVNITINIESGITYIISCKTDKLSMFADFEVRDSNGKHVDATIQGVK